MHSSIKAKAKCAAKTVTYVSAGLATSFALSVNTASAAAVGEIVLVAGQCPGGFIPLDGRELKGDAYPELAAVLNTDAIALPPLAPRFSSKVDATQDPQEPIKIDGPIVIKDPKNPRGDKTNVASLNQEPISANARTTAQQTSKLGSLEPKYCIATSGDTAPLVDVGLEFIGDENGLPTGKLVFKRVSVSGYVNLPDGFIDGDIDLGALARANPGIRRPNVAFTLVNENVCLAYEDFEYIADPQKPSQPVYSLSSAYPGELRLSGVQIALNLGDGYYPPDLAWGDDFDKQRANIIDAIRGGQDPTAIAAKSSYSYIAKVDENGRPGFVAVDITDDRTLILENRNTVSQTYNYRVQAQCGVEGNSYNVYFDPTIRSNGGGGGGYPY